MRILLEEAAAGDDPPAGFSLLTTQVEADYVAGPYYVSRRDDRLHMGFRVKTRHRNPNNVCHGGMIASFADMLTAILEGEPDFPQLVATISLTIDYIGATPIGAWVEATPEVLHTTGRMLFMRAVITADGEPVARSNAIFRIRRSAENDTATLTVS